MKKTSRGTNKTRDIARKALSCFVALSMATMLTPSAAFAVEGGQHVEVNGSEPAPRVTSGVVDHGSGIFSIDGEIKGTDTTGLIVDAQNGGEASVVVNGGITVTGFGYGLAAQATLDGKVSVEVVGDVSVNDSASGPVTALLLKNGNYQVADESGRSVEVNVKGDVSSKNGTGALLLNYDYQGDSDVSLRLTVDGDVSGKVSGLLIQSIEGAKEDVLVTGTIEAKSAGVATFIGEGGKFDLTVWRVKSEIVAAKLQEKDGGLLDIGDEDVAFEKAINYIVKVDDRVKAATLSAQGTKGQERKSGDKTYQVANKGERVYLTVSGLQEGYRVVGAYNVLDGVRTALEYDKTKDQYYYVVPDGGGIFLTADISNLYDVTFVNDDGTELKKSQYVYGSTPEYTGATPTKEPTVESVYEFAGWKPAISAVTGDIVYVATYTAKPHEYEMSFDLDGGTVDGKTTFTQAVRYGDTITLPAPVRDGFEFQYWEGSRYYAGDLYKVEGPHAFKAVWKEKEPETKAISSVAGDIMPATGDSSPVAPAFVTLLVSLCALIVSRTKLNQRYVGKHTR